MAGKGGISTLLLTAARGGNNSPATNGGKGGNDSTATNAGDKDNKFYSKDIDRILNKEASEGKYSDLVDLTGDNVI